MFTSASFGEIDPDSVEEIVVMHLQYKLPSFNRAEAARRFSSYKQNGMSFLLKCGEDPSDIRAGRVRMDEVADDPELREVAEVVDATEVGSGLLRVCFYFDKD